MALGRNALLLFVPAGLFAESMLLLEVAAAEGTAQSLRQWLYRTAFAGLAAPRPASLLYAAANPTALYVLRAWLHRRRWSWSV